MDIQCKEKLHQIQRAWIVQKDISYLIRTPLQKQLLFIKILVYRNQTVLSLIQVMIPLRLVTVATLKYCLSQVPAMLIWAMLQKVPAITAWMIVTVIPLNLLSITMILVFQSHQIPHEIQDIPQNLLSITVMLPKYGTFPDDDPSLCDSGYYGSGLKILNQDFGQGESSGTKPKSKGLTSSYQGDLSNGSEISQAINLEENNVKTVLHSNTSAPGYLESNGDGNLDAQGLQQNVQAQGTCNGYTNSILSKDDVQNKNVMKKSRSRECAIFNKKDKKATALKNGGCPSDQDLRASGYSLKTPFNHSDVANDADTNWSCDELSPSVKQYINSEEITFIKKKTPFRDRKSPESNNEFPFNQRESPESKSYSPKGFPKTDREFLTYSTFSNPSSKLTNKPLDKLDNVDSNFSPRHKQAVKVCNGTLICDEMDKDSGRDQDYLSADCLPGNSSGTSVTDQGFFISGKSLKYQVTNDEIDQNDRAGIFPLDHKSFSDLVVEKSNSQKHIQKFSEKQKHYPFLFTKCASWPSLSAPPEYLDIGSFSYSDTEIIDSHGYEERLLEIYEGLTGKNDVVSSDRLEGFSFADYDENNHVTVIDRGHVCFGDTQHTSKMIKTSSRTVDSRAGSEVHRGHYDHAKKEDTGVIVDQPQRSCGDIVAQSQTHTPPVCSSKHESTMAHSHGKAQMCLTKTGSQKQESEFNKQNTVFKGTVTSGSEKHKCPSKKQKHVTRKQTETSICRSKAKSAEHESDSEIRLEWCADKAYTRQLRVVNDKTNSELRVTMATRDTSLLSRCKFETQTFYHSMTFHVAVYPLIKLQSFSHLLCCSRKTILDEVE